MLVEICDECDQLRRAEIVRLGIDGVDYELAVCPKHRRRLQADVAPFLAHARKASLNGRRPRK